MEIKSFVFLGSRQVSTFKTHEVVCDFQRELEGDRDTTSYSTLSSRIQHPLEQAESTGQGEMARAGLVWLDDTILLLLALPPPNLSSKSLAEQLHAQFPF